MESGSPAEDAVGVTFIKNEDGAGIYDLESGNYRFQAKCRCRFERRRHQGIEVDTNFRGTIGTIAKK